VDQRIQFCQSDGARIAYATVGHGPALVCDSGWVSHLEFMWQAGAYRRFIEALAHTRTIVRYDKPGTGLSDRQRSDFSAEVDVRALEAVITTLGLQRFDVLGTSQGGVVAALLASRRTHHIQRLMLYGTWAYGPGLTTDEVKASVLALIRAHWGLGSRTLADVFLAGEGAEAADWFARGQRASASPDVAAGLLAESYAVEMRPILPTLEVPTLVLHRQQDRAVPFRLGREVASLIPGAILTPLTGATHLPYFGDAQTIVEALNGFLAVRAEQALTAREREVVALLGQGHTNREIADLLLISERTAENHVHRVLHRLGLRSRTEVAAWAVEHGLPGPNARSLSTTTE
jgi:pimeloyl-ACP methyl ester carboxylesterase/DNA-binding CsgD family transcriptional regulator